MRTTTAPTRRSSSPSPVHRPERIEPPKRGNRRPPARPGETRSGHSWKSPEGPAPEESRSCDQESKIETLSGPNEKGCSLRVGRSPSQTKKCEPLKLTKSLWTGDRKNEGLE